MTPRRRSARSRRRRCLRTPAASSMTDRRSSGRASRTASRWPWLTITCCWRPTPVSDSSSWMSSRRQGAPLIEYSLSPERKSVLVMVTSAMSAGSLPAVLSMVRETSARPRAGLVAVPMKMTSSILADRTVRGPWAPSTHATASTTFDLPLPFGPTTTVTPGSNSRIAGSAKDLNPLRERDFRNTGRSPYRHASRDAGALLRPGNARRRTSSARRTSRARWSSGTGGRPGPHGRRPGAGPGSRPPPRRDRGTARRRARSRGA